MNDEAIIVTVLAATLATLGFMAVQLKGRRAKHQQSLGDMYRPASKDRTPSPPLIAPTDLRRGRTIPLPKPS